MVASGCLHPRVRHQNPDSAEKGAQRDHAGREEVHSRSDLVPAEEQQRQKPRLEEKGVDAFNRQRTAEDVADEAGVAGPVGPKLKLHRDARGNADGEYEPEDSRPETCHVDVELFARPQPEALHDDKHQSQPDAHRWEQEVKRGSQGELDSGKNFGAHMCSFLRSTVTAACSDANLRGCLDILLAQDDAFAAFPCQEVPPQSTKVALFCSAPLMRHRSTPNHANQLESPFWCHRWETLPPQH